MCAYPMFILFVAPECGLHAPRYRLVYKLSGYVDRSQRIFSEVGDKFGDPGERAGHSQMIGAATGANARFLSRYRAVAMVSTLDLANKMFFALNVLSPHVIEGSTNSSVAVSRRRLVRKGRIIYTCGTYLGNRVMVSGGYLSRIFSTTPVKPMQQHMDKVVACVSNLQPFFQAVVNEDWDKAAKIQQAIGDLENEADDIKRDIRLHLPKGIFMPVSRIDLLEMLRIQDTVANRAKDIAGLMLGRNMVIPHEISHQIVEFLNRSVDATHQARTAINELDELFETGFRGAEVELVESMIKKLDTLEKQTDDQQVQLRASLFALEETLNPVQVMFLYKIIDWIGDIADRAQRVGSRLEYLLAR